VTALALAIVLVVAPLGDSVPANPEAGWPTSIRVFRIHRKGSSIPARIDRVPFRLYVERVMASGAWPAYKPMESLKAGAAVIAARALWLIRHPQPGYRWHGRRYDIHDGSVRAGLRGTGADAGQLYRGPWDIHSKIRRAVATVYGSQLRRGNRLAKPQWSGDGRWCGWGFTGNRLPEGGVTACARKGWGWRRILHLYLPKVRIIE
jgi:hypothetical protein